MKLKIIKIFFNKVRSVPGGMVIYSKKFVYSFSKLTLLILVLFAACAKQGMPPGGPVDKLPPRVIQTIPAANATFVDPHVRVKVMFNEWLNTRTVEDAVFISPYVGEDVKIKTGGKNIEIIFPRPLRKDHTYVITLGTSIKDLHNNALEKSFTLAFSTGGVLDKGELIGAVYEKADTKGTDVWAYLLKNNISVDPSLAEPDYIVQCEKDGNFHFTHIAAGRYRLFAVKDKVADRLYTKGEDRVGVTYTDAVLSPQGPQIVDSLFFRMFFQDTLQPALVRAVSVTRQSLQLLFDQPVLLNKHKYSKYLEIFPVQDSCDVLEIKELFIDPNDNKRIQVITEPQTEGIYSVRVIGIMDEFGNPVDPEYNSVEFNPVSKQDTVKPELAKISPSPDQTKVHINQDIHLIFNEPVDSAEFDNGFSLADTLNGPVSGTFHWNNPAEVFFIPAQSLKSYTVYRVSVSGQWIKDLSGNSLDDTLYHFTTLNQDTLSGISGKILDPVTSEKNDIYVTISHTEDEEILYHQKADARGSFEFNQIMPGNYTISCFCDRDNDGTYSYGNPCPFSVAERFVVYRDTVLAKPRWPNAGNNLILPSFQDRQNEQLEK